MSTPPPATPYQEPRHALASMLLRISEAAEMDGAARELLSPELGPKAYIERLVEAGLPVEGMRLLAHLLPRREAVWWAWMVARKQGGETPDPAIRAALDAIERWIRQPNEENRRIVGELAEEAAFETPAGCAGLAVFLSGTTVGPADVAEVAPPPFAGAKAVFGSLVFSAVEEPEHAEERFEAFLEHGLELAERISLWSSLDSMA